MRVPNEIMQDVYGRLSPADFNALRHTCRSWFLASLDRTLLIQMLKKGGWWSSLVQILTPQTIARALYFDQERLMSKWISRECNLSNVHQSSFKEIANTDFSDMIAGSREGCVYGAMAFTVSLCGRFLLVSHGQFVYVYELNHVCASRRSRWSVPSKARQGTSFGLLRPVTSIICPRRVIACSMDTSAGRYSAAFLMQGRVGMVCDITAELAKEPSRSSINVSCEDSVSGSSSESSATPLPRRCICQRASVFQAPPIEGGRRSVYRNICHADDPPRSVAVCPQRNCVAFGCSAGIELHWVDALTGQDLSRWFPLSSPSDYLYFLPARRGIDSAKKLRLISSAAGLFSPLESLANLFHGFSSSLRGSGSTAVVSLMSTIGGDTSSHEVHSLPPMLTQAPRVRTRDLLARRFSRDGFLRKVSASSADHYRAVPLSDGYHILFTDPRTGNLCLGTDAPVGSLTRLLRKVWFRPPPGASSPLPILYTAGADTRHGVRVAATFSVNSRPNVRQGKAKEGGGSAGENSASDSKKQILVFYTVPPDMFHDISRAEVVPVTDLYDRNSQARGSAGPVSWRPEESYHAIDVFSDPFQNTTVYPLEIRGQPLAVCSNLVELSLDSSPEMVIWAFSAEGLARTWALETGNVSKTLGTTVQRDGSLRKVDVDGDIDMTDAEDVLSPDVSMEGSVGDPLRFDGAAGCSPQSAEFATERGRWLTTGWEADRMSGTVSVDLVEEMDGISRVDVELR